jgi:hypothetical protein
MDPCVRCCRLDDIRGVVVHGNVCMPSMADLGIPLAGLRNVLVILIGKWLIVSDIKPKEGCTSSDRTEGVGIACRDDRKDQTRDRE